MTTRGPACTSSAAVNARPTIGRTPVTAKNGAATRARLSRSGSPSPPVRFIASVVYAAKVWKMSPSRAYSCASGSESHVCGQFVQRFQTTTTRSTSA
jgi:hypothetical protein